MIPMYIWMDRTSDDGNDDERPVPTLSVAFEYIEAEEEFQFYIRSVSNIPLTPTLVKRQSRAIMHLVKGISRKTSVMGWTRNITWQEIEAKNPFTYQTLNVEKAETTTFNEFFTCKVSAKDFKNSLLRIQICDIDKYDRNVVVQEMDYWINTHPISVFTQFELPFTPYKPDLGEVEVNMSYLPTAERLVIHFCTVTNLKLDDNCEDIFIRGTVFNRQRVWESHKTEIKPKSNLAISDDGMYFTTKMIFDVARKDIKYVQLLIHVNQTVGDKKLVIGQVTLSLEESEHWRQILLNQREAISRIHRLSPSSG